jgi:hypothetical protein
MSEIASDFFSEDSGGQSAFPAQSLDQRRAGAPECPPEFLNTLGRHVGERWVKIDGSPVFFSDIVRAHAPTRDWVEKLFPPVGIGLGDFCES